MKNLEIYEDGKKIPDERIEILDGSAVLGQGGRIIMKMPKRKITELEKDTAMNAFGKFANGNAKILVIPHGWELCAVLGGEE